ncbi:hypothetical protein CFC21_038520 [Triticum aestivum]|uniref:J domain-containing protein n=2 Tax=Triticum aestivum TaxID=4565 RepID=A0A9R1FDH3_WHEAT|nr:hypothetical protein CFC21_038520 [Triticum aestivum]
MGSVDYYEILNVDRSATDDDLRRAYRQLAMRWHPDKNPTGDKDSEAKFKDITQAYNVLSDASKRAVYDQHGEEGLKGPPQQPADDIFAEFFGSTPFTYCNNVRGRQRTAWDGGGVGRPHGAGDQGVGAPPPPVETKLACTLEELYTGVTKNMKISRNVVDSSGRTKTESEVLSIEVKPGWKKGTKITFPGKGNQQWNQLPADLVFAIDERPHHMYRRDGKDLVTDVRLTLAEALGTVIVLPTLDGRELAVDVGGGQEEEAPHGSPRL